MIISYDQGADAAYVKFVEAIAPGQVVETRLSMVKLSMAAISFDFDAGGMLLGMEILGASRVLPGQALQDAVRADLT